MIDFAQDIEINNYETVVKKFEEHFIGKRNVIFERAQFNRRYQQDGEAVEEYIRVLHKMAENCNYGSLKEEMIRDRIVVGVKNLQLSEKLQLEPNLTLERAIQAACQTECVKQQQTIIRSTTTQAANVDQVYEKRLPPSRFNSTFGKRDASKKSKFQKWSKPEKSGCIRCGASKFHPYKDCPAKEVKCHKCKKVGHFAEVCYNKTVGQVTQGDDYHFAGNIYENGQNSNDWKVYVKVDEIKILFKMDTGADVNIIPQEIYFENFAHKKLCKPDIQLLGPRQVKLHVIGKFTALIEKDGRSIPGEIFVVPQLMQPLLSGKASESLNLIKRLQSIEKRNSLNPFEEYPKLFTGLRTLQGSYTIKLKDESQPHAIYTPRRIPIPLLNKTKEQLDQMVEKGVIEKVEQPTDWCAPMVIVPKPSSNNLRICVDLTALNKFVKREHYPIPSVEYTLAQMGGAKLFSKLDANSGFWQIPLSEESSSLTTFLTPFGRYRFKRLPFGISSAPEVFQRKMRNLLESQSGVNCHMDDIVIWGAKQEEHDERLRCVLRKLQDSGLTLNKEKCIFSVKEIKFLGHLITERGVLPDPNKVQAIREFPSPSSISEVRRFLGMVNFTGKFIPDLSTILFPLNQLLVKRNDWRWDSAQEEAFEKVKKLLSTSPTLTFFDPNLPTTVSADASSYGLGAVLLQKSEDGYQNAVSYASRTMSETEKRWAQIEKESLAIVWACGRFQDYLMGNTFSIETDHKPLIPIFSTKNLDEMSPRIQRLRLRMMRYSYSIPHMPGKDIVVADALSRSPIKISHEKDLENEICSFVQQITSCPPFKDENMKEIWQYQNEEKECREIKDYCEKGWPTKNELSAEAKAFWCLRYEMSVIDGLLMRNSRIYIPKSLRSKVLNSLHEGHLGIEKCRGRARSSVWWPRISQEIGELVRNCPNCIEERSNPQQPLIVSDLSSRPWEKVGIDHFYLKGKYYLLIADYYSRFPELALLEYQTTHSTIIHCKSIFARHGIPEEVRSDNGPQFGLEFKKFAKEYGFHHITSSPRFPQSNGFIESMVKNIKNQLKKGRDPYLSLLGYRTAPLENGYSPAELCMNRKLRTTVPISPVQLQSRIPDLEILEMREKNQRHKKKTHFDIHHRARELPHLDEGTRVWVKDLRVPGVVLEDAGSPRSYIVNSPKGILRRNRFHLLPNPQGEKIDMEDEEMESPEMSQCFTSTGDNTTCDSEPRTFQRSPEPVKTRSGRLREEKDFFCEACKYGKQQCQSFRSIENKQQYEVGELIHSDLCGPMESQSLGGSNYFLLFKDDQSAYRVVYFIRHKSDVFTKFKEFDALIKNQFGRSVKIFRTDNGTEYVNQSFLDYLRKNGIIHERSAPYTPQQNGFVERDLRTILGLSRSMLHDSGLETNLWAEAVNTALNRTLSNNEKTPLELWSGRKSTFKHFKIFGSEAYANIPKQFRSKWDSKTKKMIFVGYEHTSKNYRLYDPKSGQIVVCRNVTVREPNPVDTCDTQMKIAPISIESEGSSQPQDEDSTQEGTCGPTHSYNLRPRKTSQCDVASAWIAESLEPVTYEEAMNEEKQALIKNKTWELMDFPDNAKAIGCKWIFLIKRKGNGEIDRYRARLVAKGFSQRRGIDYKETFAPVVRYDSVRVLLALATVMDMEIMQFDIKTAFLNGDLDEDIYMQIPEGIEVENKTWFGLPVDPNMKLTRENINDTHDMHNVPYAEAIGCLMFLAVYTRPDIAFAVNKLSRFMAAPVLTHWNALKRIFKYLKGTLDSGILYKRKDVIKLIGYSDADFAGDIDTRRSTSGYIFLLAGGPVTWTSQRQSVVALSTTEAEYIAASMASREAGWLKLLIKELTPNDNPVPLMIDNQSAIRLILNPEFHKRTKHVDVKFHFIRGQHKMKIIKIFNCPTEEQLADLLTKALPATRFKRLLKTLECLPCFQVEVLKSESKTTRDVILVPGATAWKEPQTKRSHPNLPHVVVLF
ncbi:K02A2.6-like, partial [Cordylochernes scorpioides]